MKNFLNTVTIIMGKDEYEYRVYELLKEKDFESADAMVQTRVEKGKLYTSGNGPAKVKEWSVIEISKSHYKVLRHYF